MTQRRRKDRLVDRSVDKQREIGIRSRREIRTEGKNERSKEKIRKKRGIINAFLKVA
jgi:hypothetical protein